MSKLLTALRRIRVLAPLASARLLTASGYNLVTEAGNPVEVG